jgi:hypothetical protein
MVKRNKLYPGLVDHQNSLLLRKKALITPPGRECWPVWISIKFGGTWAIYLNLR